jgi:hypothetical protein
LAGEAAAENVHTGACRCVEGRDIGVAGHVGPMLRKYSLAKGVLLALPQHPHSRTLEAEVESSNAGE